MHVAVSSEPKTDEYDFDSSDEEDIRNTIGNIPVQWYDSLAHVGYDTSGRPIMKPNFAHRPGDSIDEFLRRVDTGMGESNLEWRTVRDPETGQYVVLSDKDLDIVTKLASSKAVTTDAAEEPYKPWDEWFTKDVLQMPVTAHPPQKRSFVPSAVDRRRVGRMVHAIKMGWLKPRLPAWALSDPDDPDALRRYAAYMTSGNLGALDSDDEEDTLGIPSNFFTSYVFPDVWADQDRDAEHAIDNTSSWRSHLPMLLQDYRPPRPRPYQKAPDEPLPGHIASYNPPPEFLLSKDEQKKVMKAWRERLHDGHVSRVPPQMPQKFDCLRHVPFSERYLREREERVKDLIMAARVEKRRLATTPEAMLPEIPSLSQLRPYPSHAGIVYSGHQGLVTGLSISPCGQWLASISPADGCLRIWETGTTYCFRCYTLASPVQLDPPVSKKRKQKPKRPATSDRDNTQSDKSHEDLEPELTNIDEEWWCERPTATVMWNPKPELHLLAAAIGQSVFLINPALGDRVKVNQTDSGLQQWWSERESSNAEEVTTATKEVEGATESSNKRQRVDEEHSDRVSGNAAHWSLKRFATDDGGHFARSRTFERGRIVITIDQPVCSLDWHPKGDYLLTLSRPILSDELHSRSVKRLLLHRLSKMSSQSPFSSTSKVSEWRQAAFHPAGKPHLFVASSRTVRIYDLVEQRELRCLRLDSSNDYLSSMSLHVSGEHVAVGTFDGRFNWFDVDLGNVPFKKLKLNHGAIRHLDCHKHRPLVSVAMDDGTVLILHATVSDDLLSKPIIIPVQLIRTSQAGSASSVHATLFHPRQPHVYTGGADGSVRQFVAWR
ncbi:hypothetical protein EG68_06980 [Paragonimus skrjabini miyazakii]|uniref:BOP1 N-terminal domain-containing protein n=1 Tax=Paragonimus skrjabini miyazakii TaxID=59628 RepID=A0A8S9YT17_9TREM|nr:hypothetical protein EG68_06980 [Paragonimus skrjabini miyazakii]